MARCSRCNKFSLFGFKSGYCINCEADIAREEAERQRCAEEERRRQEEAERQRRAEEERRRQEEAERQRRAEEERRRQEEAERQRRAEEEKKKVATSNMAAIKRGATIKIGKFTQEAKRCDPTPLSWIVLDVKGTSALLLSQYAIDEEAFHGAEAAMFDSEFSSNGKKVSWEKSGIRQKLNGEFFNNTFSAEEKSAILTTDVKNDASQGAPGNPGLYTGPTKDKLFLLSYYEAEQYLGTYPSSPLRMAKQTRYCRAWGNEHDPMNRDPWWLRSSAAGGTGALIVDCDGTYAYAEVLNYMVAIRPAMWVDLTKLDLGTTQSSTQAGTFTPPVAPKPVRVGANAKRAMLTTSPLAAFAGMFGALIAPNEATKKAILPDTDVAYKHLPAGKIKITASNGKTVILNNNLEYVAQLEKYSCDTQCAFVSGKILHDLDIENGSTVALESV